jgi:hypothetical protein
MLKNFSPSDVSHEVVWDVRASTIVILALEDLARQVLASAGGRQTEGRQKRKRKSTIT